MAYVGRHGNYWVSVSSEAGDCSTEGVIPKKEQGFGIQRYQGCSTSLLEAHNWTILKKLLRARMQSERFWENRLRIEVISSSARWFVTRHIGMWFVSSGNSLKLIYAWYRVNIRMVNNFGKGRVFIAGGKLHHDLSISSLPNQNVSFIKMQHMSTCSQEVR